MVFAALTDSEYSGFLRSVIKSAIDFLIVLMILFNSPNFFLASEILSSDIKSLISSTKKLASSSSGISEPVASDLDSALVIIS